MKKLSMIFSVCVFIVGFLYNQSSQKINKNLSDNIKSVVDTLSPDDLNTLLSRFSYSVLPITPNDVQNVNQIATHYEHTLGNDGRWSDLNYQGKGRAFWVGGTHLTRVLIMAKSIYLNAGKPDSNLTSQTLAALKAWTVPNSQNPNWWWNRIGIPELVGEIATLMRDKLPSDELERDIQILRRSSMKDMTGANLTWCAINQVILGCLEKSSEITRAAYNRLYQEIQLTDQGEGIQPDFSFHQHGPQFYSGAYGLFYANDVGRFIYVAWGTPFQIPGNKKSYSIVLCLMECVG